MSENENITETSTTTSVSQAPTSSTAASTGGSAATGVLVVLLVILAVAGAAVSWYGWQQFQFKNQQIENLVANLQDLRDSQQKIQLKHKERLDNQYQQLANMQKQFKQQQAVVNGIRNADRSDWQLAEVEYLLRLANQHAVLSRDGRSAAALLQSADDILEQMDDMSLTEVRRKLAEEITSLGLQGTMDREGLYLKLDALAGQIEKMPVIELASVAENLAADSTEETPEIQPETFVEKLKVNFLAMLDELGAVIRIQRHEEALGPLLPPSEQAYLKQNLRFMLEQAQLAVLQQRQTVYQNSLQQAGEWIASYFIVDKQLHDSLQKELDTLLQVNVEQALPDISASLKELQKIMKLRHQKQGLTGS